MDIVLLVLTALFLPLFPFSMLMNLLFTHLQHPLLRIAMIITWPLVGLALVDEFELSFDEGLSGVVLVWSVLTAALYALRMLALRELNIWVAFLATSLWSTLWIPVIEGDAMQHILYDAAGFSAPLIVIILVASLLSQRYGAAYAGIYNGIAIPMPRLASVLVISVLAGVGTPLFPAFFSMLSILMVTPPVIALALLTIWLLWSWAGVRILQGFIVGESVHIEPRPDISMGLALALVSTLAGMLVIGVLLAGEQL